MSLYITGLNIIGVSAIVVVEGATRSDPGCFSTVTFPVMTRKDKILCETDLDE